ncbi:Demethylrebeccamycin-D-glucose O-methyltransferase [Mycobacterium basiliense]|uniref:Demethylrebeccamycin-D-glucose O-methyltransferase n=1 Tax=Mycobacterium basiliense TaxID=2094119 RepID=A0A3S4BFZ3_9MYCO|nr:class I SAM-dependent methyltransferase [Mycobacterium basiliense]VDM87383.1 Demethylrebeccamycin-D-glucose O-methyltransferase [Mycobacterium basiliense]
MTKNNPYPDGGNKSDHRDYLPAAGHDALLPGYDLLAGLLGMNKVYRRLIAQAEVVEGQRILEIGCGTGNLTLRVKRAHPSVEAVGSDPDPLALHRARRKARLVSGIRFDRGYAQQLPYGDAEFDRVLSSMMLHHIDNEKKPIAAQEIFRVLRPSGSLHLVDIGGDMTARDGLASRLIMHCHHAAGNLGDSIPRLLRAAGFDVAEVAAQRHVVLGRLVYYRAIRPAPASASA